MRTRAIAISSTVCALVLATAIPAAADPGETTLSVTVTGGSLSMTVQAAAGSLGSRANTVQAGIISGPLGEVQVLDSRSAAAGSGWIVKVISTALTPTSGPTIGAAAIGYTAGPIAKTGTATFTANDPPDLTGAVAAVTATGITGDNSATWNPTINVHVAGGTVAGTYTGTITHSLT